MTKEEGAPPPGESQRTTQLLVFPQVAKVGYAWEVTLLPCGREMKWHKGWQGDIGLSPNMNTNSLAFNSQDSDSRPASFSFSTIDWDSWACPTTS